MGQTHDPPSDAPTMPPPATPHPFNGHPELQNPLTQKLMRAFMQMSHAQWHERTVAGCTPSEIRILVGLHRAEHACAQDMKVSEISKMLHVTSPAVTQLLKGLEARGLVERYGDERDRRSVHFRLTETGRAVILQVLTTFTASIQGLIAHLGEDQSTQLADLLTKMFTYFNERGALTYDTFLKGDSVQ